MHGHDMIVIFMSVQFVTEHLAMYSIGEFGSTVTIDELLLLRRFPHRFVWSV